MLIYFQIFKNVVRKFLKNVGKITQYLTGKDVYNTKLSET